MKYYICEQEKDTLVVRKEISLDEYSNWKKCTDKLKYYSMANCFRDIAIRNGVEVQGFLSKIRGISKREEIAKLNTAIIGREANRLMLNYLVSFRTFADNMQAYSHHMKSGKQFEKQVINQIYDSEAVYRFLSKLRNFATHFSMVFDSITLESNSVRLVCSKEHLLEYQEWNTKNIAFIKACPEEYLPIHEYIEHNNVLIMSIYLGFLRYFGDDIQEMHNDAINLMKEYQIVNPFFLESESTDLTGSHVFGLGLDILKKATDEFAQLPNVNVSYFGVDQILAKDDDSTD